MQEVEIRTMVKDADKKVLKQNLINTGFVLKKQVVQNEIMFDKEYVRY